MDWADEHYVKLFTRDTVTWRSWPWETRALFPSLMRVVSHAGMLQVGSREPVRSVALMVSMPVEVVKIGLDALLADGTVELVGGHLIIPKFNEAQETRKSNAQSKREQREKVKDLARAMTVPQVPEVSTPHRQTAADGGRSGHPSAQPSPAQPVPERTAGAKAKRAEKPPDPRHAPLVKALCDTFASEKRAKYPFGPMDAAAVTALLAKGIEPTIVAAWTRALRSEAYPVVRTLPELVKHLAHFVGAAPPGERAFAAKPSSATCAACGAAAGADIAPNLPGCYPCIGRFQAWCDSTAQPEPWRVAEQWAQSQRSQGANA